MSELHPLAEVRFNIEECSDIELFALTSLHQERLRRSMEVLEDLALEVERRKQRAL